MQYATKVEALIGKTPLVDLSALGTGGARILGKYEATNPGGSIKDRIARAMLDAAEADGRLAAGGTVIEPTSGNTGVGLAMLAAARGYRMILVMPDTMSIERRRCQGRRACRRHLWFHHCGLVREPRKSACSLRDHWPRDLECHRRHG